MIVESISKQSRKKENNAGVDVGLIKTIVLVETMALVKIMAPVKIAVPVKILVLATIVVLAAQLVSVFVAKEELHVGGHVSDVLYGEN
jgi:hypothetical protein